MARVLAQRHVDDRAGHHGQNTPGRDVDWYPFVFGCLAGIAPWIVGGIYFAVNQFLQYKAVGKWRSYVFGEGVYIALSFVAKSALMWQVFFGTSR